MAEVKDILILANSVRSQKHCVAGKAARVIQAGDFDVGNDWIRLNDPSVSDGAVPYAKTIFAGGGSVRPLQFIKVNFQGCCNDPNHPEDWNFEPNEKWTFEGSATFTDLAQVVDHPTKIWHDKSATNSVLAGYVPQMATAAATLYLIKAPVGWSFTFWKEWNSFEKKETVKRKLHFVYEGDYHEFSVTDQAFTNRHKIYDRATMDRQTLEVQNSDNVFFCLSLTKLTPGFNDRHYKICATIFEP